MMQPLPSDAAQSQPAETTERARRGDQKAFTQLYEQYKGPICTYLASLVGNEEMGRDLTQETFFRAWKGLPQLQESLSFRSWLYRIATTVAQPYLQRDRLPHRLTRRDTERETTGSPGVAGPEAQTGRQEWMTQGLAALPPHSRASILLQQLAGFAQHEIATVLGLSEKRVSTYVSRGCEQLRLAYQQFMHQPSLTPCPFWAEQLATGHPDDLPPVERLALQTHLASCPTCAAVRATYEVTGKLISQLPAVEPPAGLPPRLLHLWHAPGDEQAARRPSSAHQALPAHSGGRRQRKSALARILVAIVVVGALLGSLLAVLVLRHPGPAQPTLAPTSPAKGWKLASSPNVGSTLNNLNGVAVISPSDAWAVGYSSNGPSSTTRAPNLPGVQTLGGQTLIAHWNGSRWSVVPSPNPGSTYNGLSAVAAISASDIWAVGYFSNSSSGIGEGLQTLIAHWNGSRWSVVPSPNQGSTLNILNGVAAVSASDIWAVGHFSNSNLSSNTQLSTQTLIEHWNGTQWRVVPSPNPGATQNELDGVTVISPSDVWAVGRFATITPYTFTYQGLIEHWNGTRWSVIPSVNTGLGGSVLNAVAADSANDVWAVGVSGYGSFFQGSGVQTLIEHWNGSKWSIVASPNNPLAINNFLNGVTVASANDVWAVGGSPRTYPLQGQTLLEHWNGSKWSIVAGPNPGPYNNFLAAVAQDLHSSEIWAVGSSGEGYTPERTIVEIWGA